MISLPHRPTHADLKQFSKFVVVGVVNTAFSYAIYSALIYVGLRYALANLVAVLIGIVFSFKTQGTFVFGSSGNRRLVRFAISWGCIYLVNVLLIGRFIALGFDPYVSGALAIPFMTVLSFVCQKYFVFRPALKRSSPS